MRPVALLFCIGLTACGGWAGGTKWVEEGNKEEGAPPSGAGIPAGELEGTPTGPGTHAGARTLGMPPAGAPSGVMGGVLGGGRDDRSGGGRVLGTFRNTYYDFPREADHSGASVPIMSAACQPIAQVPRTFYEAVCVQGSGSLTRGGTVSFAKRDCACAEVCPRTGQRICFDALDPTSFPWGRGAAGTAIIPLRTIAADTSVLPMGTILYIPELDGAPREGGKMHDGCFVVEDRGLRVKGEHVDIFTGNPGQTAVLNERVPSNQGVTVIVDAPRCAHLAAR